MSSSPLLRTHEPPHEPTGELDKSTSILRDKLVRFFSTRAFHYSVLLLVALDVGCMFADIVISLETCDRKTPKADTALEALKHVSLVFSTLFMLELLASVWAFRTAYFKSKFHMFDAAIIVVSFIFEISLQGVEEEVASLIVILRLLRVVKIVDEISVGAEAQMSDLEQRLELLEKENSGLREELRRRRPAT
ncbi:hypothetical protein PMIN06_001976 [Paraphaeosphaeria minitans]